MITGVIVIIDNKVDGGVPANLQRAIADLLGVQKSHLQWFTCADSFGLNEVIERFLLTPKHCFVFTNDPLIYFPWVLQGSFYGICREFQTLEELHEVVKKLKKSDLILPYK